MRCLLITTGVEGLLRKTLESFWEEGKYTGDILVLRYDYFSPKFLKELEEHGVMIVNAKKEYPFYGIDRIRVFHDVLPVLYKNYDVIMHVDGDDVRVFDDVNPLFELAKDKICVIQETNGKYGSINREWRGYKNYPVEGTDWWNAIKNGIMINAGLYLGPATLVYDLIDYMYREIDKLRTWGVDQVILNKYVYYHKSLFRPIGIEWGYLGWFRDFTIEYDGCYANINGNKLRIHILHLVNIAMMQNKPWDEKIIRRSFDEKIT